MGHDVSVCGKDLQLCVILRVHLGLTYQHEACEGVRQKCPFVARPIVVIESRSHGKFRPPTDIHSAGDATKGVGLLLGCEFSSFHRYSIV